MSERQAEIQEGGDLYVKGKQGNKLTDLCVCCGKMIVSAGTDTHAIDGVTGRQMNLSRLIRRFGGLEMTSGSVCSSCVSTIQSLQSTCNKFYELCQTTYEIYSHLPNYGLKKASVNRSMSKSDECVSPKASVVNSTPSSTKVLNDGSTSGDCGHSSEEGHDSSQCMDIESETEAVGDDFLYKSTRMLSEGAKKEAGRDDGGHADVLFKDAEKVKGASRSKRICHNYAKDPRIAPVERPATRSSTKLTTGLSSPLNTRTCATVTSPKRTACLAKSRNTSNTAKTKTTDGNANSAGAIIGSEANSVNNTRKPNKTACSSDSSGGKSCNDVSVYDVNSKTENSTETGKRMVSLISPSASGPLGRQVPSRYGRSITDVQSPENNQFKVNKLGLELSGYNVTESGAGEEGNLSTGVLENVSSQLGGVKGKLVISVMHNGGKEIEQPGVSKIMKTPIAHSNPLESSKTVTSGQLLSPKDVEAANVLGNLHVGPKVCFIKVNKMPSAWVDTSVEKRKKQKNLFGRFRKRKLKTENMKDNVDRLDESPEKKPKTHQTDLRVDDGSESDNGEEPVDSYLVAKTKDIRYFTCCVCNMVFYTNASLSYHWLQNHGQFLHDRVSENSLLQSGELKCKLCEAAFATEPFIINHVKTQHGIALPFSCTICNASFEHKRKTKMHIGEHFMKKAYSCSECEGEFESRQKLERHVCWLKLVQEKLHKKGKVSVVLADQGDGLDSETEGDFEYPCPMCKEKFLSKKRLSNHWKDIHNTMSKDSTEPPALNEGEEKVVDGPLSLDTEINEDNCGAKKTTEHIDIDKIHSYVVICGLCNTALDSTFSLKEHWDNIHVGLYIDDLDEKMELQHAPHGYKCKVCEATFLTELLARTHLQKEHMLFHPFRCNYCPKTVSSKKNMRAHLQRHFPCSFFRCSKCQKEFVSQKDVLQHSCWWNVGKKKKKRTRKTTLPKKSKEKSMEKPSEKSTEKRSICRLCRMDFGNTIALTKHWVETHDSLFEQISEASAAPLKNLPKPKLNYQCEWCGHEFKVKKIYLRHKAKHSVDKTFRCTICSALFSTKQKVRLHLRKHMAERPFPCNQCDKKFFDKKYLRNHVRAVHGSEEDKTRCVCEVCGKGFADTYRLSRHKLTVHYDGRPRAYNCNICGKGFLVKSKLEYHISQHSDKRPHLCNTCGKSFRSRVNLRSHQRTHSEFLRYKCPVCHRTFSRRLVRTGHVMVQHNKTCGSCGLIMLTIKDAIMHRHTCDGFEKVEATCSKVSV